MIQLPTTSHVDGPSYLHLLPYRHQCKRYVVFYVINDTSYTLHWVNYYNKLLRMADVSYYDFSIEYQVNTQYSIHHIAQTKIKAQVICQVSPSPSHGPPWGVSYTCSDPGGVVIWSGAVIVGDYVVAHSSGNTSPSLTISGVDVTENHSSDPTFINSTLTFTGFNLYAINGLTLSCRFHKKTTVSIMIPSRF